MLFRGGQDESDYEESVYSNSSEEGAAALFTEPEIKFTSEELGTLQQLVQQHDRQYKSVNFGETLIKEMIMCRSVSAQWPLPAPFTRLLQHVRHPRVHERRHLRLPPHSRADYKDCQ